MLLELFQNIHGDSTLLLSLCIPPDYHLNLPHPQKHLPLICLLQGVPYNILTPLRPMLWPWVDVRYPRTSFRRTCQLLSSMLFRVDTIPFREYRPTLGSVILLCSKNHLRNSSSECLPPVLLRALWLTSSHVLSLFSAPFPAFPFLLEVF